VIHASQTGATDIGNFTIGNVAVAITITIAR
jgi:hypothetical protein